MNSLKFFLFSSLPCFIDIPVFNANSVDPDQTLHSAASDLGLHCLPITLFRGSRLKLINVPIYLQVNIVDPLKLTQEFSTILANKIIATNVVATFILHKEL